MKSSIILLSTLVSQAVAHFGLTYPAWRIDSLVETNDSISQWTYPCANVVTGQNASQARTLWPLEGGSIVLELHHKWTYLFINMGFGNEVTNFNVSLNPQGGSLVNETGNGTFCWNRLPVPPASILGLEVQNGQNASIQVVTVGESGSALYNCADITFSSNATLLPANKCMNSTGVSVQSVMSPGNGTSSGSGNATTGSSTAKSAATSSLPSSMTSMLLGIALLFL